MPTPYRYITPVPKQGARGRVAEVYAQIAKDFVLTDGPLMSLSPAPEILTATWALLRETQLVGRGSRATKEMVAVAVSVANRCSFCMGAHTALVHAAGEHDTAEALYRGEAPSNRQHAALGAWASATSNASAGDLPGPPVESRIAGEYFGTALVTHFINRMTAVLVNEKALAGRLQTSPLVRRIAGKAFAGVVRREVTAGESLPLLSDIGDVEVPDWGEDTAVGHVYGVLSAAASSAGATVLGAAARCVVRGALADWNGGDPSLGSAWVDEQVSALPVRDRAGARLALQAAVSPARITDADVSAWRGDRVADGELVRLLAFGAMAGVDRIASWMHAGGQPVVPANPGGPDEAR